MAGAAYVTLATAAACKSFAYACRQLQGRAVMTWSKVSDLACGWHTQPLLGISDTKMMLMNSIIFLLWMVVIK